jgi:hypothetical protein
MPDALTFSEMLAAANESKTGRGRGQWTPAACKVWREAEPEASRLLEAALAWELAAGRLAKPEDEGSVRERRAARCEVDTWNDGTSCAPFRRPS